LPTVADILGPLPSERRPLPEPLPEGRKEPGFRIRGIKGWAWTPEQYLAEIPVLAKHKMNFLMGCYLSLFYNININRWWQPLPGDKRRGFERVVAACKEHGIQFCFATNPAYHSKRPLKYDSEEDFAALWQHYEWMQGLGVRWFSLCIDDVPQTDGASRQAAFVGKLLARLRAKDPEAQFIFCPTKYHGFLSDDPYTATLARELPRDVYVFWTGDDVFAQRVTLAAAKAYRKAIGRRVILWDNYPVNDRGGALNLGPVCGRPPDLCTVLDGYMSNAMDPENEANRIPVLTCADYAYNPWSYDPRRSIGQAILHLADEPAQRRALHQLVVLYPGRMLTGSAYRSPGPVVEAFYQALKRPKHGGVAVALYRHVERVLADLDAAFPDRFTGTKQTIERQLARMASGFRKAYGHPLHTPAEGEQP